MSPGTAAASATAGAADRAGRPRPGTRARLVGLVAAVLAVLVIVSLLTADRADRDGYLDPDNPGDQGAQALARVLADEGVVVEVVRDAAALEAADLSGAQVVVTDPSRLGRSTLAGLRRSVADAPASRLLLIGLNPQLPLLSGAPDTVTGRVSAQCEDPAYAGLTLATATTAPVVATAAVPAGADACFETFSGPLLVSDAASTRFSAGSALRNDEVLRADNAAVALRLLGAEDRLVWYVPDPADTRPTDGVSLRTLLPPWTGGMVLLGVLAFLAFLLWRGRRLGPLVEEPVPVRVRSAESTMARGRLYAAARDRGHAAEALRAGSRARLASRTGLGPRADLDALIGRLGEHGQDEGRARALLEHAPVNDDRQLVQLATDLTRLEDEVART
ncbi:hypothetical protein KLP28_09085 [Nocardioidaceae bacterium]|nr:hypothetical protein KLP28_09085 [Nocardioidaceae bacterium]